MRYVRARIEQEALDYAYRVYVTDSLHVAGQNKYLTSRWCELIKRKNDTRTGDEVALDVIQKAGLCLKGGE